MPGDMDPRLIALLQAVLGLADALRDAGTAGGGTLRLDREDGLAVLRLVAGADDAEAEALSQRGLAQAPGFNSLKIAGLTFEWPRQDAPQLRRPLPAVASNDNSASHAAKRFYGFEEETPALR